MNTSSLRLDPSHFSRAQELLITGIIGVPTGVVLFLAPWYAPLVVVGIMASLVLLKKPQSALTALLVFLIFQDPLQLLAGGDSNLALNIKRSDEFVILALGLYCVLSSNRVRAAFIHKRLYVAVAACYFGVVASSILARPYFMAAAIDLALFSKPFLLLAIGCWIHPRVQVGEKMFSRTILVLMVPLFSAIPFLLFPALQEQYLGDFKPPEVRLGFLVAQGIFINPGTFAWFAVATLCVSYAAYIMYGRRWYLGSCLASAVFVLVSWRRKSIAAAFVVLAVSLFTRSSMTTRRRAILLAIVAVCVCVTIVKPELLAMGTLTMVEYGHTDPFSTARSALYYTSVRIAQDHFPLGTGLASFGSYASRLYYSNTYQDYSIANINGVAPGSSEYITDTFWPMVLGEGGVISLLGYLVFLGLLAWLAWSGFRTRKHDREAACRSLVALFLLTGSMLESIASQIYGSSLQAAMIFIPAGIVLADHLQVKWNKA